MPRIEEPRSADPFADQFVAAFAKTWARPSVEGLLALLHPNARLAAPMMPVVVGHRQCAVELERLLAVWPDVHLEVVRSATMGNAVFIELILHATFAGKPVRIPAIDRILLEDGLCLERVSFVADLSSLLAPLMRPTGWFKLWRYRPPFTGGLGDT